MTLREYQLEAKNNLYAAWQSGAHNVMLVLPTGAGKTVVLSSVIQDYAVPTVAIAHRLELVSQMSLALNREHVTHCVIAPNEVVRQIMALHHSTHGYSRYSARAATRVAAVDTLLARDGLERWAADVKLIVIDEAHHAVRGNKWARAAALFPNARGLFVTAHAIRADGRGLGRTADGLVDTLIVGPTARDLINQGYLTDYRVICPPNDLDFSNVPVGDTGDYTLPKLRAATHKSGRIVGDVVNHYGKWANKKLGLTFAVDVEAAKDLAAGFRGVGVPAEVITAKTDIRVRGQLMRQFRERKLLQLVSVDTLGEGTDVPAIEVVSMVRKTASFQLFAQQFGRALRPEVDADIFARWSEYTDAERRGHIAVSVKPHATIIDHVGNVVYHGPPDAPQNYSLSRAERRSRGKSEGIPLRVCLNPECMQPYEAVLMACPYCLVPYTPAGRGSPEQVGGDLVELDPAVLAQLRGEIERVDGAARVPTALDRIAQQAVVNRHLQRQRAQVTLRAAVALYGGWQRHMGREDREGHKRFYYQFGVDVATLMTLGAAEATALEATVRQHLLDNNVTELAT